MRRELIPLTVIVAIAAAVRFSTLGLQSFDSGETVTAARIIHPSYIATFHAYSTIERSGPLYYTLAWAWAHLFGTSEAALRSLSAIFGTATVGIVFLTARRLLSARAALIAAALAAVSPDLLWYSQEARSYPLFIMLTAAALYFFVRALQRPSRGSLAGWAICSALALSTHYFAAFSIGPEALWLLWSQRRAPRRALYAVGGVGAVGLALLPLAIHQEGTGRTNAFTAIPVLERVASSLVKFMTGEGPTTTGAWTTLPMTFRVVGLMALAVAGLAVITLIWRGTSSERRAAALVGGVGALAFCVPIGLALAGLDYIEPRNLLGSLVPLLIVVAAGIDVAVRSLGRHAVTAGARLTPALVPVSLFAAVILATGTNPALQRDNWRGLGRLVAATRRPGVILAEPASAAKPLHYFLGRPLAPLKANRYPCGVRSRTIVTISRRSPRPDPASGFKLASSHRTAQGWVVASFRAPSSRPLDSADLRSLGLLGPAAAPRVDVAPPVTPGWDDRQAMLAGFRRGSARERFGDWAGMGLRGAAPTAELALRGWPPPSCGLAAPSQTQSASTAGRTPLARVGGPAAGRRRTA